jgi:cytochrome d ubiquinol oxidase subunit II
MARACKIQSAGQLKTEGELFHKAARWGRHAFRPMVIGLGLISEATPLVSAVIADRWFILPNIIGLMPILGISLLLIVIYRQLSNGNTFTEANPWVVFACLLLICILAATGLAYSIFPDIIIGRMTIWEAASATASLQFVLVGVVITLPIILSYNIMVYRIFRGKATHLSYD